MSKENSADLASTLKARTQMKTLYGFLSTVSMGIIFGFVLNKGRVFEPGVIIDQFKFKRFIMMKMFLSAAATSAIAISIVGMVLPKYYKIAKKKYATQSNLLAPFIGGTILGAGMTISGACPGMVLISLGAGIPNSVTTLIAGSFGALAFGTIEPFIRPYFSAKHIQNTYLEGLLGIPSTILSFTLGAGLFGFAYFLETLFPWRSELTTTLQPNCDFLSCKAWNPMIAGTLVGLLQIPSIYSLGKPIGCSSSYVCATGQWLRLLDESSQNYFKTIKKKINSFWTVTYVTSAILGSTLAVYSSKTMDITQLKYKPYDNIQGTTKTNAFIGGFIMIFGARLAKGCTSGHGLSGMGFLCTASMVTVAAMFLGGGLAGLVV